jgi:hypothetical protein
MHRLLMVVFVTSVALLLSACAVGRNHTADAALERNFIEHQMEIEALLTEVQADSRLVTLQPRTLIYAGRTLSVNETNVGAVEKLGMPRERWYQYQREMQGLGIISVIKGERGTEFRVDRGSILNGDSYKGYWYAPHAPYHVRASLDSYRRSDDDKDRLGNWGVCKPLKENWYLYLFVNR